MLKKLLNLFLTSLLAVSLLFSPCLARENKWTSKPPLGSVIDPSHPLSKGLVGAWLMNEGAGNVVQDIAKNNNGLFTNTIWKNTLKGVAINNGTSGYVTVERKAIFEPVSELTIVQILRTSVTSGNISAITKVANNGGSNAPTYTIDYDAASSYKIRWFGNDGSWRIVSSDATGYNDGKYHMVVGTHQGTTLRLYIDSKVQSTTASLTFTYPTPEMLLIGAYKIGGGGAYTGYFNGDILLTMFYSRALSPQEIQSLYIAPYQMIKMPSLMEYGTGTIAAGVIKSFDGIAWENVKSVNGISKSSIKSWNGMLAN